MGNLLLHNPWVQFYLVYVGALAVVFVWDSLRNRSAIRDSARTPPNEAAQGWALTPPRPRPQEPCSVSRPGRRTEKEVEPTAGITTWGALRTTVAAPTSGKRREYHVVTP
jgi:hypothetical protein